jgi:hypothetical protein
MAFINIDIQYKLAVRNGFVEIPGDEIHKTSLTPEDVLALIPGSVRRRQSSAQYRIIDQEWIELPAFDRASGPSEDFYEILRAAAD